MPYWIPRTKLADFMEYYSRVQEIPIWTSAVLQPNPEYNADTKTWTIRVDHEGVIKVLKTRHLVMATGLHSTPRIPNFMGMDTFKGTLMHSSRFKNANGWKGKKVVIIGMVNLFSTFSTAS